MGALNFYGGVLVSWGPWKDVSIIQSSPREGIVLSVTQCPISQLVNSSGNLEPEKRLSFSLNSYSFF